MANCNRGLALLYLNRVSGVYSVKLMYAIYKSFDAARRSQTSDAWARQSVGSLPADEIGRGRHSAFHTRRNLLLCIPGSLSEPQRWARRPGYHVHQEAGRQGLMRNSRLEADGEEKVKSDSCAGCLDKSWLGTSSGTSGP